MKTGHLTHKSECLFSGFLDVCHLGVGNAHEWYTTSDVVYYSARFDYTVRVPIHFISDLASIPSMVHFLISDDGYERFAAVVHDWLCVTAELPRAVADAIFKEACIVSGVPMWKVHAMHPAVRLYSVTGGRDQDYNRAREHPDLHFVDVEALPQVNRREVKRCPADLGVYGL